MATWETIKNPEVAAIFAAYPAEIRPKLMFLRQLIFDVASRIASVGELEKTLLWGQPSYLRHRLKGGT